MQTGVLNFMKYFKEWLSNDRYIRECVSEIGCFHHYKKHLARPERKQYDSQYVIFAHYSYKSGIYSDSDLFKDIKPEFLNKLRARECVFVLDGTHEGWAPEHHNVAVALYNSAIKHNIDPAGVTFLSGNLREKSNFRIFYNGTNQTSNPINVIEIMHWDTNVKQWGSSESVRNNRYTELDKKYDGTFFLNLNRRNRFWRSYCVYKLQESGLSKYGAISHDELSPNEYRGNKYFSSAMQKTLVTNTPMIVDTTDFQTNWANNLGSDLQNKVLFNLTNETMQSDWCETSLFYSEKTFKPILHKVPVIIWGQTGQNYNLQRLGYKLYTDWFNYDFDFETDIVKRWDKLQAELIRVCKHLEKMSRSQQIEWSMQNKEVLDYNANRMQYNEYTINEFLRFTENCNRFITRQSPVDDSYQSKNVF